MRDKQKALIITVEAEKTIGLDELNEMLSNGWRVVTVTPMGGANPDQFCAMAVVEHRADRAATTRELEEELEEITEGDGTGSAQSEAIELPGPPTLPKGRTDDE